MLKIPNIISLILCFITIALSYTYQHLLFYKKIKVDSKISKLLFYIIVIFCVISILSIIIFALLPQTQI